MTQKLALSMDSICSAQQKQTYRAYDEILEGDGGWSRFKGSDEKLNVYMDEYRGNSQRLFNFEFFYISY